MTNQLIIFFLFLLSAPLLNSKPIVKTENGILVGTVEKSRSGRNYSAFLGVRYGKPPVGDLRFKNPVPAEKWNGIRNAKSFGNSCLHTLFGVPFGKEDCLFLNIYSPFLNFQQVNISSLNKTLLPVMVFIHGGAFFFGSGNDYKANYIMDKNVIFVTINYRLGIFGFLTTADTIAPGNFALKDQLLALKWIQRNIEFFGGDRNRVTLSGQSAGSVSVHLHAINQRSSGLFHQYIMQSGTALSAFAYRDRNEIFQSVKKMAQFAMCPTTNTQILMDCLRKVDGHYLLILSNLVGLMIRIAEFPWQPTNEPINDDAFLTENPQNLMHQMKDAPFICGVVGNEGAIITNYFYTFDSLYNRLKKYMKKLFIDDAVYIRDAKKSFPNELYKFYFNNSQDQNLTKKQFLDTYTNIASDGIFNYPAIRMLDQIEPKMKSPNYFYRYIYRGKNSLLTNILSNENFGAGHAGEIVYLFPIQYFFINRTDAYFTDNDRMMSKITVDLWTSFAINGIPTSKYLDPPNLWKPYNTKSNPYLQIGDEDDNLKPSVKLSSNFLSNKMDFWKKIH
ncbi:juvenile hormone esterase-like [Leptopilina heterotoma]|uniref:juvenile hormone esterase-like n=1 Tax=Leptopilina heterotoma TaxID=63436 RepID=UPI001CA9037D|nr:juvenile hormone esterase-like [Leptopilina heterotoma]